jgi:hypothetical protein
VRDDTTNNSGPLAYLCIHKPDLLVVRSEGGAVIYIKGGIKSWVCLAGFTCCQGHIVYHDHKPLL